MESFVAKGGTLEATEGRKCLCNGLLAAVGLGQVLPDAVTGAPPRIEPAIVTAGAEAAGIARFLRPGATSYSAREVLEHILAAFTPPAGSACGTDIPVCAPSLFPA